MKLLFNPTRDRHIVLMYHYIFEPTAERRGMHPRAPADFERELDWLTAKYRIGTPLEVLAAARRGGPPTAALTFDDATRDQYENAAPRLEARGLRGSFFVIGETLTGHLPFTHQLHLLFSKLEPLDLVARYHRFLTEQLPTEAPKFRIPTDRHLNPLRLHDDVHTANFKELFPALPEIWRRRFLQQTFRELKLNEAALTTELFMSEKELADLAQRGHLIGLHGQTHQPFDTLTPEQIKNELQLSRAALTPGLGQAPVVLSYPYGRLPAEPNSLLKLVTEAGIESAVMMEYRAVRADDQPLLIPRFNTNHLRDWLTAGHLRPTKL